MRKIMLMENNNQKRKTKQSSTVFRTKSRTKRNSAIILHPQDELNKSD